MAATFSGIPYSNECRPGCLNFSLDLPLARFLKPGCPWRAALQKAEEYRARDTAERRHALIPERLSRTSVYASTVTDRTRTIIAFLAEPVASFFPVQGAGDDFTALALIVAAAIDSAILDRRMIYVDLNAIIADYLVAVLEDDSHAVTRLLFDGQSLDRLESLLGPVALFSRSGRDGARFALFSRHGGRLRNGTESIAFDAPSVREGLRTQLLCPGLFLTYFALAFLNGFQCLGGFNQVRYLARFRDALGALPAFGGHPLRIVPTNALALGRAQSEAGAPVFPIDALFGQTPIFDPRTRFGEFAAPTVLRGHWQARPAKTVTGAAS